MTNFDDTKGLNEGAPPRRKSQTQTAAWGRVLSILLLLTLSVPTLAAAPRTDDSGATNLPMRKMSADLQRLSAKNKGGLVTVIVQFGNKADASAFAGPSGATLQKQFSAIHAVTLRVPASML